jgi:hypothetical protein
MDTDAYGFRARNSFPKHVLFGKDRHVQGQQEGQENIRVTH